MLAVLIVLVILVLLVLWYNNGTDNKYDYSYMWGNDAPVEGFTPVYRSVGRGKDSGFNRNPYYASIYPFIRPSYANNLMSGRAM